MFLLHATPAVFAQDDAFFENQVRPILVKHCQNCHGAKRQSGGLRLDSREAAVLGGDRGPALVPGQADKSLMIQAVSHNASLRMPPKAKLSGAEVAVLTKWVSTGAFWPREAIQGAAIRTGPITPEERQFWSLQPVKSVAPPKVNDVTWPRNDVDRFVLKRLEDKKLTPAVDADRRTLIRRVTFDLIGLPPTPEEVEAFRTDRSPDAFAAVVDRLLASKHYGERWGRHWLDVVRYADTAGETADYPVPQAYRYRNWVIDTFNSDMPYDEFIRLQLAGDILAAEGPPEKYAERITGTGFIAISRRFGFDPENYFHLTIQDTIDTVGQTFLGLSLGCARCHDNKFDPVFRGDYYALYGIFDSTRYSIPGSESKSQPADFVPLVPPNEAERLKVEADKAKSKAPPFDVAYGAFEGKPRNARVHKRGEPRDLGDEVPRRWLEALGGTPLKNPGRSGRLELADWIASKDNPLSARVMVNRIWQHHFGVGIVATPNDFGTRGQRPTHPELLDFLAAKFIDSGYSAKAMHRLIVLSHAYQTSGQASADLEKADPTNALFGRYPLRRLDAESIRDAMLTVAGTLDRSPGGAHPFPAGKGYTQHNPFSAVYETKRRSVYLMTQRIKRHPFLALFDGADTNTSTPQRFLTTVPTQALFLMNDPFVHEQAAAFAGRILAAAKNDRDRIRLAFEIALARPPQDAEQEEVGQFLRTYRARRQGVGAEVAERESWTAYARTLLARNEFLFVR